MTGAPEWKGRATAEIVADLRDMATVARQRPDSLVAAFYQEAADRLAELDAEVAATAKWNALLLADIAERDALRPDLAPGTVEALVIRPGDTLIVRVSTVTNGRSMEHLADMRALIMQRLPQLADVIVMTADGFAVYRPDEVTP